jgi:hypothetical protein
MAKGKKTSEEVEIPQLKNEQVVFTIEGIAPLIVNKFSEKAKQMILDTQMKKAKQGREAKDPDDLYKNSIYFFPDNKRTGFPAVAVKAAMVRAAKQVGMTMTDTRGMFHVMAEDGTDLLEIIGEHAKRSDMVRLATGVADVRFRAEYKSWKMEIPIIFNASVISKEQLANILNTAGFACGLGEWRPEKSNSGSFGLFKVV